MPKFLSKTFAFLVLGLGVEAPRALASIFQGPGNGTTSDTQKGVQEVKNALQGGGVTGEGDFAKLVLKYVNFLLPFLALFAFVGYVYAGVLYVTAFGEDEAIAKSKKILIYSTVGLIVVILSYTIVQLFTVQLVNSIGR